jgi:hypothetical protein
MDCPKCKTPDAYQGFNYRDGQVDCLNKRCSNYSAEHAKKTARASNTNPPGGTPLQLNPTTYEEFEEDLAKLCPKGPGKLRSGRAIAAQADAEAEEWDKLWDEVFDGALRLFRGETLDHKSLGFNHIPMVTLEVGPAFIKIIKWGVAVCLSVYPDTITLDVAGQERDYWGPAIASMFPPDYREHYFTRALIKTWKDFK